MQRMRFITIGKGCIIVNVMEEMTKEKPYSVEQLNIQLERVNRWIENCDQKAYILLAFIGACLAALFTSNTLLKARTIIIKPFYAYLSNHDAYSFSIWHTFLFLGLLAICWFGVRMIISLLRVLTPNINTESFRKDNPTIEYDTQLHFHMVAKQAFDAYKSKVVKEGTEGYLHDLCSQIYINSKICNEKFENLKNGLQDMMCLLISIFIETMLVFFFP